MAEPDLDPEAVREAVTLRWREVDPSELTPRQREQRRLAAELRTVIDRLVATSAPEEALRYAADALQRLAAEFEVYPQGNVYEGFAESANVGADQAALFKTAVKEIAHRHGVIPTFMPKWNKQLPGSSGHLHQSLWDRKGARNLFVDPKDELGMSKLFRHYLAGQLEFMRALMPFTNPTVNSYKRTVPGLWAPDSVSWGLDNRTTSLRVIRGPGATATRVEYRLTGGDINPHLALAATIAAGLYGVTKELSLQDPIEGSAYHHRDKVLPLPRSLESAVDTARAEKRLYEILPEELVDHFLGTREWEIRQFQDAVTDWEVRRYFEII